VRESSSRCPACTADPPTHTRRYRKTERAGILSSMEIVGRRS
jgi:hypothetical protein